MNQKTLGLITIFTGVLFVISLGIAVVFGVKLNSENKSKAGEISTALASQESELKKAFQKDRETTTTKYVADEVFGSFEFDYPKVWSTNVTQDLGASQELVFLADPNLILVNKDGERPYPALKVIVYQDKYATKLKDVENSNKNVKNPMTETDITVSDLKGKMFTGADKDNGKKFVYVIVPLRDKTLYIGTDDSDNQLTNFETILKTFKISK